MAQLLRTIAIVGGGFSGAVLAANLLKSPLSEPTRIVVFEQRAEVGPGVAYSVRNPAFLLNVPAGRMSATSSDPRQFLEFARRRVPGVEAEDFLPRRLYGEYLQELLLAAELSAPSHVRLERRQEKVTAIHRVNRGMPLQVDLASGGTLTADDVVLATGNPPPADLPGTAAAVGHPRYIRDAYASGAQPVLNGRVLLIGTGLTMADTVLAASADPGIEFHALSRHGLIPPVQTAFRPDAFRGDGNGILLSTTGSLRRLVNLTRMLAREAEASGGDWREAVTFVRELAPTLWQRLSHPDRQRFLRHLRTYWDIHRHRLPLQTVHTLAKLRKSGRLQVHAGRLDRIEPQASGLRLVWRPRGEELHKELKVDWVVNCTGPDYDLRRSSDPLLRSLLATGLAVSDPLGLGLRTGANGAVIDADGWPGTHLFYVGPMLRADHWEATAAAELRVHAERLATHLATRNA